ASGKEFYAMCLTLGFLSVVLDEVNRFRDFAIGFWNDLASLLQHCSNEISSSISHVVGNFSYNGNSCRQVFVRPLCSLYQGCCKGSCYFVRLGKKVGVDLAARP